MDQNTFALADLLINQFYQAKKIRDDVTVVFPLDVDIFRFLLRYARKVLSQEMFFQRSRLGR